MNISAETKNYDLPPLLICKCPAPPPVFVRIGVGVSFWEPARTAEVVRTPFCSPTLGGSVLGNFAGVGGTHNESDGKKGKCLLSCALDTVSNTQLAWYGVF